MTGALALPSSPTVAVAFGGGGARGLAHIHVIEALDEMGIRPVMLAGSSIGAIMGAAMASGMSGAEIREHSLSILGGGSAVVNRLWGLRPATLREAMNANWRVGQFDLEPILGAFLPPQVPARFEALGLPLSIHVTDYYGQCEKAVTEGALLPALAASAALPALFRPVMIGGRVMIDGGFFNPIPYEHLLARADIVIGVDVVGAPEGDGTHMPSRMDSLFGASQLMMQAVISMKLKLGPPHILLRPAVGRFRVLDFLKAREVLDATAPVKDELKRALEREMRQRS